MEDVDEHGVDEATADDDADICTDFDALDAVENETELFGDVDTDAQPEGELLTRAEMETRGDADTEGVSLYSDAVGDAEGDLEIAGEADDERLANADAVTEAKSLPVRVPSGDADSESTGEGDLLTSDDGVGETETVTDLEVDVEGEVVRVESFTVAVMDASLLAETV